MRSIISPLSGNRQVKLSGELESFTLLSANFSAVYHEANEVWHTSARSAAPLNFHDLSAIYMVVASRRDSYDNLVSNWRKEGHERSLLLLLKVAPHLLD